jgi:hypothetical protein
MCVASSDPDQTQTQIGRKWFEQHRDRTALFTKRDAHFVRISTLQDRWDEIDKLKLES